MFSATFSDKIVKFAQRYLNSPVRVAVKAEKITADKIKHDVIQVRSREDKFDRLLSELEARNGSVIIFVKTRRNADQLAKKLCDTGNDNIRAEPIHGDLRQRQRDRTIKGFQLKQFRILVATDVASRGLDIPHIEHVINFDLPQNPEDYVHRIGRTARAGAEGEAICFVTPSDGRDWSLIERMVFPNQAPTPYNQNAPFKKSGARGRGGKPSFRNDNRSDSRSSGGRFERTGRDGEQSQKFGKPRIEHTPRRDDRSENAGRSYEKRTGRDSEQGQKFGKPRIEHTPRRDDRSENAGLRTDSRPSLKENKPASGDKRTPRSDQFKKSEGFKKSGGFAKRKSTFSSKPSGSYKKAV